MIKASFIPNRTDYIQALRDFQIRQRSTWIFLALGAAATVCTLTLMVLQRPFEFNLLYIFPVLFLIFFLLILFFVNPIRVGDQVRKNERLRSETTWEVDSDQIVIRTAYAESKFDWGTIGQVYESDEHFLMIYSANKRMFQILPKRAFASAEQMAGFRALVELTVGSISRVRSLRLPAPSWPVMIVILVILVLMCFIGTVLVGLIQALY